MIPGLNPLYTYGYGNGSMSDLHEFVNAGAVVADVRYAPYSHNPEWKKENLAKELGANYVWIPALGNVNYKNGKKIAIPQMQYGLAELRDYLECQPVVLLCVCPQWEECHRRMVADRAAQVFGIQVWHLGRGDRI